MISPSEIARAALALREGKLVAFPTETVYGLGANALDEAAAGRIYEVKRRPRTSPLIVHVSGIDMARKLAAEWPETAQTLAERFWPGPLTLVVKKAATVPPIVTSGGGTVGLRMPNHPVAAALLREAGIPIAAPSANRFTELSPTTAEHVRASLGADLDIVLDGGECDVGIESTVLSVAGEVPRLLRPGMVSREAIEAVIGSIAVGAESTIHESPGMHPKHYSPRTPLVVGDMPRSGRGVRLAISGASPDAETIIMPRDPEGYAHQLYATLHRLDYESYDWISVEPVPEDSAWDGIRDRLTRASEA